MRASKGENVGKQLNASKIPDGCPAWSDCRKAAQRKLPTQAIIPYSMALRGAPGSCAFIRASVTWWGGRWVKSVPKRDPD